MKLILLSEKINLEPIKSTNDEFELIFRIDGEQYEFNAIKDTRMENTWIISFSKNGGFEKTNKNKNMFYVFGAIIESCKLLVDKYNVDVMTFSALKKDTSRVRLYNTLIRNIK